MVQKEKKINHLYIDTTFLEDAKRLDYENGNA
jgi:hypothetical protein